MATAPVTLLTVEEFATVPNPPEGVYELFHGELVKVSFPEFIHVQIQLQIRTLLEAVGAPGKVKEEMPFRPLPEYECWCADVAYVSIERWLAIDRWLLGAPDLVVEVLSPSNTASEMLDKEQICLENGSREFWQVDPKRKQVKVSTLSGHILYRSGQAIPLYFAPGKTIAVDRIFE